MLNGSNNLRSKVFLKDKVEDADGFEFNIDDLESKLKYLAEESSSEKAQSDNTRQTNSINEPLNLDKSDAYTNSHINVESILSLTISGFKNEIPLDSVRFR